MHTESVQRVREAVAFRLPSIGLPGSHRIFVAAVGIVPSSGWSHGHLSPRYPIAPPADGVWEFDFVGDPPIGPVLSVELPIAASDFVPAPAWARGVRIIARDNDETIILGRDAELVDSEGLLKRRVAAPGHVIVSEKIAVYDDSFQPIGTCGVFHVKMKKLRHELTVTIEGPDEAKIRKCLNQAVAAGLLAVIISAFTTGGIGLGAAIGAATSALEGCLGSSFKVRFDDRSHWIEWCT
ncbi:MAG: hypothetical protein JWO81_528 [Alphaproteobacteria bacterium]|nr:hypothetical protein [Alphaproteobacteria bacterium]